MQIQCTKLNACSGCSYRMQIFENRIRLTNASAAMEMRLPLCNHSSENSSVCVCKPNTVKVPKFNLRFENFEEQFLLSPSSKSNVIIPSHPIIHQDSEITVPQKVERSRSKMQGKNNSKTSANSMVLSIYTTCTNNNVILDKDRLISLYFFAEKHTSSCKW